MSRNDSGIVSSLSSPWPCAAVPIFRLRRVGFQPGRMGTFSASPLPRRLAHADAGRVEGALAAVVGREDDTGAAVPVVGVAVRQGRLGAADAVGEGARRAGLLDELLEGLGRLAA